MHIDGAAKPTVVSQTAPHTAYVMFSIIGVVFDFIILLSVVLISLGLVMIGTTLLLPLFEWLFLLIGYPPSPTASSLISDIRDLNYETVVRILAFLPPILFALFREQIARPFRSVFGVAAAVALCLPGLQLVWLFLGYVLGFAEYLGTPWLLQGMTWVMSQMDFETGPMQSAAISVLMVSIVLSGFLFLPYLAIFLIWRKRLGRLRPIRRGRNTQLGLRVWIFVKVLFTNWNTQKGVLFLLLACAFGSLSIVASSIDAPAMYQRFIVDFARSSPLIEAANAALFVGLADALFGSFTVMIVALCGYIVLVRPRLIKVLVFGSVLPIFSYLAFLIPPIRSIESGPTWIVLLIFLSISIIPFLGFLHAGYKAILFGFGLAQKASIKSTLADRSTLLLLRCFALDDIVVKRSAHIIGAVDALRLFVIRLEEVIVREAFLQAPVIAVANPQEPHEPLGALREYLSDDDWQPFVAEKIDDSQAIIFILGRGNYTGWETSQILNRGAVSRVIFIVPPDPQPALDYLDQNPDIREMIGGDAGMRLIGSRNVRGFAAGSDGPTFITNQFASELSYRFAMRRLLEAVNDDGALATRISS